MWALVGTCSSVGTIIPAVRERREGAGIAGGCILIRGVPVLQLVDVQVQKWCQYCSLRMFRSTAVSQKLTRTISLVAQWQLLNIVQENIVFWLAGNMYIVHGCFYWE